MARLTPRSDDRGQLLLVGAFVLAILLVTLAVVLNGAVYTETVAARGSDRADVFDAVGYRADVESALAGVVAGVNAEEYVSGGDARGAVNDSVADWDTLAARQQAATGRAASVSVANVTTETRVTQTNASAAFTNASGTADWTLVTSVNDTPSFEMTVNATSLPVRSYPNASVLEGETFHVVVDASENWTVFVYRPAPDNVTVAVLAPGASTPDNATVPLAASGNVTVDFVAGTVEGENVDGLSVSGAVAGPYSVRFVNGNNATGTYSLVVDGDVADATDYATDSAGSPTARAVVTELVVDLRYDLPNLHYETPVRVTGGADA